MTETTEQQNPEAEEAVSAAKAAALAEALEDLETGAREAEASEQGDEGPDEAVSEKHEQMLELLGAERAENRQREAHAYLALMADHELGEPVEEGELRPLYRAGAEALFSAHGAYPEVRILTKEQRDTDALRRGTGPADKGVFGVYRFEVAAGFRGRLARQVGGEVVGLCAVRNRRRFEVFELVEILRS